MGYIIFYPGMAFANECLFVSCKRGKNMKKLILSFVLGVMLYPFLGVKADCPPLAYNIIIVVRNNFDDHQGVLARVISLGFDGHQPRKETIGVTISAINDLTMASASPLLAIEHAQEQGEISLTPNEFQALQDADEIFSQVSEELMTYHHWLCNDSIPDPREMKTDDYEKIKETYTGPLKAILAKMILGRQKLQETLDSIRETRRLKRAKEEEKNGKPSSPGSQDGPRPRPDPRKR